VEGAKFLDAPVKSVEEIFDSRDYRRCDGESSKKEQAFVETDELMRVELELRELREEFSDEAGRVRVEAALYGFQLDKEMIGIVLLRIFLLRIAGKCGHARRDSVTQARVEAISDGRVRGFYCSLSTESTFLAWRAEAEIAIGWNS
jgi:hypothetical protein